MRLPPVPVRLRWLVAVMAVAALTLGAGLILQRKAYYEEMAARHAEREYYFRAVYIGETYLPYDTPDIDHDKLRAVATREAERRTPGAKVVRDYERLRDEIEADMVGSVMAEAERSRRADAARSAQYHRRLKLRYLHAARRPWLVVDSDPLALR
jgi:hypothetical protein